MLATLGQDAKLQVAVKITLMNTAGQLCAVRTTAAEWLFASSTLGKVGS